jgi:hypothetical protein
MHDFRMREFDSEEMRLNLKKSVAAPATVSGESLVQNGHWATGKAGRAAGTREPGDLPARSPNRWTGSPYGAVFRSGDGNAGAKAVRRVKSPSKRPETSASRVNRLRASTNVSFASGLV